MVRIRDKTGVKLVINHQLRFIEEWVRVKELASSGKLGEIRFIRASCRMNLLEQGTHLIDLVLSFNEDTPPEWVMGQVDGVGGFRKPHSAPDAAMAAIYFQNGVRALVECGTNAPDVSRYEQSNSNFHAEVYGSEGQAMCTLGYGWREWIKGQDAWGETRKTSGGQKELTEAMCDWLDDDAKKHPTRLEISLISFDIIMGVYQSALKRGVEQFPLSADDTLCEELEKALVM